MPSARGVDPAASATGGPPRADELKRAAAERAAAMVEPGMALGLGTGSTAALAVEAIGRAVRAGSLPGVRGVPTSERTRELAREAGIPLTSLEETPGLDLTIDGADEVDPRLDLIKGGGGALLREKIVAVASRRNVIVVDEGKLVGRLGVRFALPVEVVRFGWRGAVAFLGGLGAAADLRRHRDGAPYVTDEGHYIVDCRFPGGIADAAALERSIRSRPGIVETGLFLGLASVVIVAGGDGVEVRERAAAR
ncbi:MAG TPA: ribose-5-phosphate isomerase RpiA [Gemmatimonadota bacterium]